MDPWTWQDELVLTCVGAAVFGVLYLAYYFVSRL